jgi:transposase
MGGVDAALLPKRSPVSFIYEKTVERFFAWIQWQRRILVRWEYYIQNFLGFVQLACLVILFRRF